MSDDRNKDRLVREREYTLDDEQTAEARRLAAKIAGRRVTGEIVIDLSQGGVSRVRVREVVKAE